MKNKYLIIAVLCFVFIMFIALNRNILVKRFIR